MKTRQKILLTALSAALIATLTSGLTLTALADQATEGHEFDGKLDVVFEDFDRDIISDTVKAEGDHVDLGEKPYLHVEYTAGSAASTVSAIYKQGSGSFTEMNKSGKLTFKMRAPNGNVNLSDLKFGVRDSTNQEAAVLIKSMSELKTADNESLPAQITAEWQNFEIGFATSYEDDEVYPTTQTQFKDGIIQGIHLFAAEGAAGVIDIASVTYNQTVINDFRGGDDVAATAKLADAGTWWAESAGGHIVKRAVKLTEGGSFSVVKTTAVGNYDYAIIETEGDTAHLKVATTTDGTTWGTPEAYDGYSVALNGTEKGFKFSYDGSDANGVTVTRIYLTNAVQRAPETVVPVIDAESAEVLDDFSFAQKGFTGVYDDMIAVEGLADAGLDYRLSYDNGNLVEVKDGCLVFDATTLVADGNINFKFKSKSVVNGKYVVFKMRAEDGADLTGFRFGLGDPDDAYTDDIWSHDLKVAYGLATPLLDESNPYRDGDWYYIVVDIEESGFAVSEAGYCGMNIRLGGTGKLYIDTIFFVDEADMVLTDCVKTVMSEAGDEPFTFDFQATDDGYQYACQVMGLDGTPDFYNALAVEFEIAEGTDLSGIRFECKNGMRWAGGLGDHDADGYLYLTDGTLLADAGFVAGQAKTVYIDLEKSDIELGNFHIHTNGTGTGSFKINSMKLVDLVRASAQVVPDAENAYTLKTETGDADYTLDFQPTSDGYQYVCEMKGIDELTETYDVLAIEFVVPTGTSLADLRFQFTNGTRYAGGLGIHDTEGYLYLTDGTLLADTGFVADEARTVYIDLEKSDIEMSNFHIHTGGTGTGPFKINSMKLMKYTASPAVAEGYAQAVETLPTYLDTVKPEVHITTPTTATAGDEITVAYTATDDVASAEELEVTVSVTKDGEAVTLTEGKFTAAEGVYTVTVTARDVKGNEASDTIQITVSAQQGGGTQGGGTQGGGTQGGGTTPGTTEGGNGGLSTGAIVGIVIGVLAGVVLIAVIIVVVRKKRH